MKKIRLIRLFIATSLLVLSSCEDNFDPKIFGTLNPDNFPSTETEYKDYALACYIPFTTTWTYYIGTELRQHGFYIPEGGILRMFESPSDNVAVWGTGWGEWLKFSQANFNNCIYYERSWVSEDNINHIPKLAQITRFTEIISTLEKADENIICKKK